MIKRQTWKVIRHAKPTSVAGIRVCPQQLIAGLNQSIIGNRYDPLAGIAPDLAAKNAEVRVVMERLNYARNEVARRYLDGAIDSTQAIALMQRWWFQSPEAAAKTLRFAKCCRC